MAKILIVEDDKRTNMAICEYLKPTGHNIVSAYDGEEALQLFHSTTIDLIVLDIMLPRLTGIAVLHEIRKSSLIPVLMLTAIEDEYTQSQSFDELADDYVTKPFSETRYCTPDFSGSANFPAIHKSQYALFRQFLISTPSVSRADRFFRLQ